MQVEEKFSLTTIPDTTGAHLYVIISLMCTKACSPQYHKTNLIESLAFIHTHVQQHAIKRTLANTLNELNCYLISCQLPQDKASNDIYMRPGRRVHTIGQQPKIACATLSPLLF